jgi:outer membrane protein assembly factor BamA
MQALREIYEVVSDTITINIPKTFPSKKVEVIVLPLAENRPTNREEFWKSLDEFRQELARSGRAFSDSAELIREERDI